MDNYSSDQPIANAEEDLFGRAKFAKRLSKTILEQTIEESYAIGLYSPWGYGKTSVLHMVQEHLDEDKVIVVKFNPWAYTNQEAMIKGLLVQLAARIEAAFPTARKLSRVPVVGKYIDKRTNYGTVSVKGAIGGLISEYAELTGVVNENLGKGVTAISHLMGGDSLEDVKEKVEKRIKDSGKRVIVIIDDVDRLDKEEAFQLFKLIKVVTDFRGITYLIAFDDVAVGKALNSRFSDGSESDTGRQYIEKIIQIPLHLPMIERDVLDNLLFDGISKCLDHYGLEISDDDAANFRQIYDDHVARLMKTPRAVNRYVNSLMFTIPLVGSEVDIVDLLLIEAIRLHYPEVYNKLRTEKRLMTGSLSLGLDEEKRNEDLKIKFELLTEHNEALQGILRSLFPRIEKLYSKFSSQPSTEDMRTHKFVASIDYYDRYFTYGVTVGDISDAKITEILALANADDIRRELSGIVKNTKQDLLFHKLRSYYKSAAAPLEFAKALIGLADKFSNTTRGVFRYTPLEESADLVRDLLDMSTDRLASYSDIVDECKDLDQLTYLIREVVLGSEEKEGKTVILKPDELDKFKEHVLKKIRKEARARTLHSLQNRIAHHLYSYWSEFGSREEVNKYLLSKLKTREAILDFITRYLAVWTGANGSHRGNLNNAAFVSIRKVVNTQQLYEVLIKQTPTLKNIDKFPELEDADSGVGKTGNELKPEFRKILEKQFIYQQEHSKVEM